MYSGQHYHDSDGQRSMNEATPHVAAEQCQQPHNQKIFEDGLKQIWLSSAILSLTVRVIYGRKAERIFNSTQLCK